jgi:hypothetical protein
LLGALRCAGWCARLKEDTHLCLLDDTVCDDLAGLTFTQPALKLTGSPAISPPKYY